MGGPMESRVKDVMTVPELCEYLQLSEATVREMLRKGTIPAVLIGRQWRIRKTAIDGWLAAQEKAVKMIRQRGGDRRRADWPIQAASNRPQDLPLPKPPRPPRTVEEVDPGARNPRPAPAPTEVSPEERRKMAKEAIDRGRRERKAKGRA
jgi:excisionase family DNA binding protein